MRVHIYFNLHRGGWSIRDASTRRVIGHAATVALSGVTLVVHENARQRVLRTKQREVHAYAVGELVDGPAAPCDGVVVSYNPFRAATFHTVPDGAPVHAARFATFESIPQATGKPRGRMTVAL